MDCTSLSEQTTFINLESMRRYVIDYYKNNYFRCAEYPFIDYDPNLQRVGVKQFTWHNSIDFFKSEIFLKTHTVEQNLRMIEYFYKKCSKSTISVESGFHIEQIPFLLDQNNHLQLCKDIYFPTETVFSRHTIDFNDFYVHQIVFIWLDETAPKGIKQWLEKLGVTSRTDLTYLYKTILPNAATYITLKNAIKTIKMLFMLFEKEYDRKKRI